MEEREVDDNQAMMGLPSELVLEKEINQNEDTIILTGNSVIQSGEQEENERASSSSSDNESDSSSDSDEELHENSVSHENTDTVVAEQWFTSSSVSTLSSDPILITSQPEDDDIFSIPHSPRISVSGKKRSRPSSPESDSYVDIDSSSDVEGGVPPNDETTSDSETDAKAVPKVSTMTCIPPEFHIFESIGSDDSFFPILKGIFKMNEQTQRAWFTGQWAFTESDFHYKRSSAFEYSSIYIHPWHPTPYSGSYGGFFLLKQFNGKSIRIKEDKIEFHFIPMEKDNRFHVIGRGTNRYGKFLVRGSYTAENGQMTVRRRYLD